MKLNIIKVFFLLLLLSATSCTSYKKIPYFQVEGDPKEFELQSLAAKGTIRFQPEDIIGITLNVPEEQLIVSDYSLTGGGSGGQGVAGEQTFLVSSSGEINFPTLGLIKVAGFTPEELQEHIKQLLSGRMKIEPIVNVRLTNFRIYFLGDAGGGQITVDNKDRIDIFEALSLRGDMSISARRDRFFIRRQFPDGKFRFERLDISKPEVFSSPYFYLRQNDLVYIQPGRAASMQPDMALLGTISGLASFILTIFTYVTLVSRK